MKVPFLSASLWEDLPITIVKHFPQFQGGFGGISQDMYCCFRRLYVAKGRRRRNAATRVRLPSWPKRGGRISHRKGYGWRLPDPHHVPPQRRERWPSYLSILVKFNIKSRVPCVGGARPLVCFLKYCTRICALRLWLLPCTRSVYAAPCRLVELKQLGRSRERID